jgi:hypothetical protein
MIIRINEGNLDLRISLLGNLKRRGQAVTVPSRSSTKPLRQLESAGPLFDCGDLNGRPYARRALSCRAASVMPPQWRAMT